MTYLSVDEDIGHKVFMLPCSLLSHCVAMLQGLTLSFLQSDDIINFNVFLTKAPQVHTVKS